MKLGSKGLAFLVSLHSVEGLGTIRLKRILDHFTDPKLGWEANYGELKSLSIPEPVFKNLTQAKSFIRENAIEKKLCLQVLGLEKGKGSCFNYQINKCSGACMGYADEKDFAKSFEEIFKKRKLRSWPFKGPILVKESKDDEENHSFVLDNWCLLKDVITTRDDTNIENYSPKFDYDSYKIFLRYLKNPLNKKSIKPLKQNEIYTMERETEKGERYVYID